MEQQVIPDGYKQTEVGLIPEEWDVASLGDLGEFKNGINKDAGSFGHGYPFVNLLDVFGSTRILSSSELGLIDSTAVEQKDYSLKKSDVLFIRSSVKPSGVGLTAVINSNLDKTVYSGFLIRFRSDQSLVKGYKEYCFYEEFFRKRVIAASSVSANTNINQDSLKQILIAFPKCVHEQTAIANALSDVDALIASIEKLIAKKNAIRTATMQQLLTGKKRLPPFDRFQNNEQEGARKGQLKGTKQTELGEIPKDWGISTLEPLIRFSNGAAHENSISAYGQYTVVNSKFISTEGAVAKYSESCFAPTAKGNVLMVMSDVPNGKAIAKCYLVDEDNKYTVNQRICSLEPIDIDSSFLFYSLNRNDFYLKFDDGAKQTNLRRQDVLDCPLVVPSFEEQQAIAEVISNMDIDLITLKSRLLKTLQIKQGMMQELLTGKTRLI